MRCAVLSTFAIALAAGSALAQSVINDFADATPPAAKFDPLALAPGGFYPPVPSSPEEHAAWLTARMAFKPIENILKQIDFTPALSQDADAPNWYVYHGATVPLRLWGDRIAVQFEGGLDVRQRYAVLAQVGLRAVQIEQGGSQGWAVYHLERAITDCTSAKDIINTLVKLPGVQAASPVFHAPLDAKLWLFPAADLTVQMKAAGAAGAGAVAAIRPDLTVNDVDWAGCPGMMRVLSPYRNGFETIKAAAQLAANPAAAWSEPLFIQQANLPFTPNDASFGTQWWLRNTSTPEIDIGARRAWNVATGGGIRIVVIDNGFQRNHPDVTFAGGRDFTDGTTAGFGDGSPGSMCDRHGTPCGGIIAASTNNSTGVAGAAFGGQTYVARVMYNNVNADGSCAVNVAANAESATLSVTWLVNGLNWGATNACRISSQSIGFGGPSNTYESAINTLHSGGMAHFCSSGNDGSATVSYPASYGGCNSVGSVDSTGVKTNFSQFGNGLDLTAPGTSIFTTDRSGTAGYNTSSTSGDYTSFGGTSSAAPVAAGTAALALSSKPWLTAGAMETDLYFSTIDRGAAGYDTTYGYGIINAYNFMVYYFETQVNDRCGNATNLGSGTSVTWSQNVTSAIDDAVAEAQESCEAGNVGVFHSVWFTWTAPSFGTINLDTNGSNYDTVLSVWDGCGVYNTASDTFSSPTQLGCSDDIGGGNLLSSITGVGVRPGQTVRIKVSRYGRSPVTTFNSLSMTLHVNFIPGPPPNTLCSGAEPVVLDYNAPFYPTYTSPNWDTTQAPLTVNACSSNVTPSCVSVATVRQVWWTFTAPSDGVLFARTEGSSYDTVMTIYDGCGRFSPITLNCIAPTQLACSDDVTPGTLWSQINNFNVFAGQTYKIRIAGYGAANAGGIAKLIVYFNSVNYPPPVNDACANATVIPSSATSFADSVSTLGASTDSDCGDPPANPYGTVTSRSAWWTFTPETDGLVSIDTLTSTFDTTMTIYDATYTGCAARDGNNVCVYPDYVTYDEDSGAGFTSVISGQPLVGGHVYLFRVAGYSTGSRGTANFQFSFSPSAPAAPANDAWVAAVAMGVEGGGAFTSPPIDTRAATSDTDCGDGVLTCTGDALGNSIWFTITPTVDGFFDANTLPSDFDTVLAVFDATGGGPTRDELGNCINPPELGCNDNVDEFILQSALSVTLLRNHTYLVAVFARDGGGQAVLDSAYTPACPADLAGFGGNIGPDHFITVDDLVYFLSAFFANDARADIATTGGAIGPDGQLTVDDLVSFLQVFFGNCN